MIKPDYVNFEQAKLLYEKTGLTREHLGFKHGSLMRPYFTHKGELNGDCLDHITKLLKKEETFVYACPEHWQVIDWLRLNHNIDITHSWYNREGQAIKGYSFEISFPKKDFIKGKSNDWEEYGLYLDWSRHNGKYRFDSPQEAYSAAFTYILNELI